MQNQYEKYLDGVVKEINDILDRHNVQSFCIPESLMAFAIVENSPEMIEEFLEDGFTMIPDNRYFGWINA